MKHSKPPSTLITQLRSIDTPTLANAIEQLKARPNTRGFCDRTLRCFFPELGVLCGYAVTVEVETMSDKPGGLGAEFIRLLEAIADSHHPVVVAFQEKSDYPEFSAHCGEVMATGFKRLGAVGVVSDGAVRDVAEVRALDFHYFAPGVVASHANFKILRVQVPITVAGLQIEPGDILHGDINGLIKVPDTNFDQLRQYVQEIRNRERELIGFIKSDSFRIDALPGHLSH